MKFFKCHSAKFKNNKVLIMATQFTEVGPDAFVQTDFDVIVLSDRITTISEHAFSKVRNCSILIPSSVVEIDPYAFEGMGEGNVIFCEANSSVHKFCLEYNIEFNNDMDLCMKNANLINQTNENDTHIAQLPETEMQLIKKQAEQQAQAIINEALAQAENIKKEMYREADKIMKAACEQADMIRTTAIKDAQSIKSNEEIKSIDIVDSGLSVTQETNGVSVDNNNDCEMVEFDQLEDKCDRNESCDLFVEQFGTPPVVEKFSPICYEWQNQILQMETQDIIDCYNSDDYCDEYKYFCYMELQNRYTINSFEFEKSESDKTECDTNISNDNIENQQKRIDSEQLEIHDGIGRREPPEYECMSKYHFVWMEQLRNVPTEEIIERYKSSDYNEEYKFLCYQELINRQDLEGFSVE